LVASCIRTKKTLTEMTLAEYRQFYPGFEEDLFASLTARQSVNARKLTGGTAEETVRKRIEEIEKS
jgi:argininosuccinate lyase